jgi:hypothetical protein
VHQFAGKSGRRQEKRFINQTFLPFRLPGYSQTGALPGFKVSCFDFPQRYKDFTVKRHALSFFCILKDGNILQKDTMKLKINLKKQNC